MRLTVKTTNRTLVAVPLPPATIDTHAMMIPNGKFSRSLPTMRPHRASLALAASTFSSDVSGMNARCCGAVVAANAMSSGGRVAVLNLEPPWIRSDADVGDRDGHVWRRVIEG
ncbi:hypothetical protein, variant [Aphanomyces astaci]|uniref:Uncharacterized protein n=1 Tax=Aphanomyces astaci TaxID=112090 RepID=W4G5A2_APHAT|nr:hypothetical protein, variant [Aphanomyces astaci]ETV74471.1 hypothetical protein, variant [Aphanomyces astaci]|eukprot:XP_009836129.1 hypothetical protein, variant [Aphanomyces astaci]